MLFLKYPMETNDTTAWRETLHSLVVTHATEHNVKLKEPVLIEGKRTVTGTVAINEYIEDLKNEIEDWWYCSC